MMVQSLMRFMMYLNNSVGCQILYHHNFLHDKVDSQATHTAGIRTMSAADLLDIRNPRGSQLGNSGILRFGKPCNESARLFPGKWNGIDCTFDPLPL